MVGAPSLPGSEGYAGALHLMPFLCQEVPPLVVCTASG